ncbi:MAG: M20/M25/M40 family metallo-hydrolase, partial [Usitatibacter sp.]
VQARESLKRKAEKIAEASGLTAQVAFTIGYPVLSNNPALMRLVMPALERAAGPGKMVETPPILAAEDFGAYGASIPAVYWFLAASPLGDKPGAPNHSPFFTVDESVLRIGVRAMVGATLAFLQAR